MSINSREKGKAGEREFAALCREHGFENARRGQQFNGLEGKDVVGLEGIHIEVKRVERLNIDEAMKQSIRDSKEGEIPIVAHRKNRESWKVTMRAEDWFKMYKVWRDKMG
jgi:Holliday junction resolvase